MSWCPHTFSCSSHLRPRAVAGEGVGAHPGGHPRKGGCHPKLACPRRHLQLWSYLPDPPCPQLAWQGCRPHQWEWFRRPHPLISTLSHPHLLKCNWKGEKVFPTSVSFHQHLLMSKFSVDSYYAKERIYLIFCCEVKNPEQKIKKVLCGMSFQ